jgi:hypothetical protein
MDKFSFFRIINTEVAEQGFSRVDRLVGATSFMKLSNFMWFVRFFFAGHNKDKMEKWEHKNNKKKLEETNRVVEAMKKKV